MPERIVRSPDGREWRVRVTLYRRPERRSSADGEETYAKKMAAIPFWGPIVSALLSLGELLVVPAIQAVVAKRPWIEASAEHPPVTLVWRATGRVDAASALEEIADALQRGEERPEPFYAQWVGYDRGTTRLPQTFHD